MKTNFNKLIAVAALVLGTAGFAQVGIGTDNPEATLDIRATNHNGAVTGTDGLLVPRVNDLSTAGTINGQLVYLTTNAGTFTAGFHYWNGSAWTPFSGGGGAADGNGIYTGTGDTTAGAHTATLAGDLTFNGSAAGNDVIVGANSTLNLLGSATVDPLFVDGLNDNAATPTNTQLSNDFVLTSNGTAVLGGNTAIAPFDIRGMEIIGNSATGSAFLRMASDVESPVILLEGYSTAGQLDGTGTDETNTILAQQDFNTDPVGTLTYPQLGDRYLSIRAQGKRGQGAAAIHFEAAQNQSAGNLGTKIVFNAVPLNESNNNSVDVLEVSGDEVAVTNGTNFRTTGAVYRKIETDPNATIVWDDDDYMKIITNNAPPVELPAANLNNGREICISNATGFPQAYGPGIATSTITTLAAATGHCLVSNGSDWYVIGR